MFTYIRIYMLFNYYTSYTAIVIEESTSRSIQLSSIIRVKLKCIYCAYK
jgi:hypothetical protein